MESTSGWSSGCNGGGGVKNSSIGGIENSSFGVLVNESALFTLAIFLANFFFFESGGQLAEGASEMSES